MKTKEPTKFCDDCGKHKPASEFGKVGLVEVCGPCMPRRIGIEMRSGQELARRINEAMKQRRLE